MSIRWREVGSVLIGCILMILGSASNIWIIVGIKMLDKITFLDVYYINILNALLPAGIVAGTIIFSIAAELVGRKITLLSIAVPYIASFIIFQFAKSISVACIGRVMGGFAVGGSYVVLPIYIGEIAEPSSRGVFGSIMSLSCLIGALFYYLIAVYSTYTVYNIVTIVLSIIFFFLFLLVGKESPYYYKKKQKFLAQSNNLVKTEINKYQDRYNFFFMERKQVMSCLGSAGWIKSLIMMSLTIAIHHLSGSSMIPMLIHYVISYLGSKDINITYDAVVFSSVGLELIGSFICTLLVDRLGRKPCLIISAVCISILYIPIAIFATIRENNLETHPIPALTILFVVMFLIFFNIGIAPIPSVLLGELFPQKLKMIAAAYIVSFQQVTFFVVTIYFQEIAFYIGYTTMLFICMVFMLVAPVFIHFGIMETKGKTLEEIQIILNNK